METSRKHLKEMSIVVLIFAALSLIRVIAALIFDEQIKAISAVPGGTLTFTIITLVIALILTLPQIYVGIKGYRISKNPNKSKSHIVWATILGLLSVISMIAPIVSLIRNGYNADDVSNLLDLALDVCIYCSFVQYAAEVRKAL
ncbi:MAG: hypothetical protein IKV57_09815 [Clostridia bacterium]|nr:hypothetical protein [Clostridia bacterium]